MNKILVLALALVCLNTGVYSQIGINTSFPQQIFHVDGAGDNTSTNPTTAQQLNDVVITAEGNLGIGTTSPTVKVDITNKPTSTVSALRIEDTSGSLANKVLESDANGIASWTQQPASINQTFIAVPAQKFYYAARSLLQTKEAIKIPTAGKYLLTIRWVSYYRLLNTNLAQSIYIYVKKSGETDDLDQIEYYIAESQNNTVTFTTSLYLGDRTTGETIEIYVKPQIGGSPGETKIQNELYTGTDKPELLPQIILYNI